MATMQAHAEQTFPEECVGVLFSDGTTRSLHNAAVDRRSHFLVSARDFVAVENEAEAKGLFVSGFYHSHPDGVATPSPEDAVQATPGALSLIVQVIAGRASVPRAFRFEHDRFVELEGVAS